MEMRPPVIMSDARPSHDRHGLIFPRMAPPRCGADLVGRRKLLERLSGAAARSLAWLRAPVGYGKTTLMAQLRKQVVARGGCAAWLSMDRGHDDTDRFLDYLRACLHLAGCCAPRAAAAPPERTALGLLNEIHAHGGKVHLFLDDFHHVADAGVHGLVEALVQGAPPNFHVVVASRGAPPAPLAALRVHGRLVEFALADLAFDFDETRDFLDLRLARPLPVSQQRAVHDLSGGWPAALHHLAEQLRRQTDIGAWVAALGDAAGAAHAAQDFVPDLLAQLPPDGRRFVDDIAILECFDAALCDAVCDRADAASLLARLRLESVVLVPVPERDGWYRLHPLLAAWLRQPVAEAPHRLALHRRACEWLTAHGHAAQAVPHALAAKAPNTALALLEHCAMDVIQEGHPARLLAWFDALPLARMTARPPLLLARLWALILTNRLGDAHHALEALEKQAALEVSSFQLRVARGALAARGLDRTAAAEAIDTIPPEGDTWHVCVACNVLGWGHIHDGRFRDAVHILGWSKRFEPSWQVNYTAVYRNVLMGLAFERMENPEQAESLFREALAWAERIGGRQGAPACLAAGALAERLYVSNRVHELEALLANRYQVLDEWAHPGVVMPAYLYGARVLQRSGALDRAFGLLGHVQAYGEARALPGVVIMALAEQVRLWLACGDVDGAAQAQRAIDAVERSYAGQTRGQLAELAVHARISRARLAMARGDFAAAGEEADIAAACSKCTPSLRLTVLVLQALCRRANGASDAAGSALEVALRLSEKTANVRGFIDEGRPALELLLEVLRDDRFSHHVAYLERLMLSWDEELPGSLSGLQSGKPQESGAAPMDRLSRREHQILCLLSEGMPNKRIALRLNVSVETVKWHLKNLYGKLRVTDRYHAVQRARTLGIEGLSQGVVLDKLLLG